MSRRPAIILLSLVSSLPLLAACDPEYSLCVVTTSCLDNLAIMGAHVVIQAYDVDGHTNGAGRLCKQELNFPEAFQIQVDAPGYQAKTDGPFSLGKPGANDFEATVCLDPQP